MTKHSAANGATDQPRDAAGKFGTKPQTEATVGVDGVDLLAQHGIPSLDSKESQKSRLSGRLDMLAQKVSRDILKRPFNAGYATHDEVLSTVEELKAAWDKRALTWQEASVLSDWAELERTHGRIDDYAGQPIEDTVRSLDVSHRAKVRFA